jgi:hypothetical protein
MELRAAGGAVVDDQLLIEPVAEMGPKRTEEVAVSLESVPPTTYTNPLFTTAGISTRVAGRAVVDDQLLMEPVAEMGPKRTEEVGVPPEPRPPTTYTYPLFTTAGMA